MEKNINLKKVNIVILLNDLVLQINFITFLNFNFILVKMHLQELEIDGHGIKIFIEKVIDNEVKEVAHAYLYILNNDLHDEPFGLMEDVFVIEEFRGQGLGGQLVKKVIEVAKREGCYKLICTSRYGKEYVHKMYHKLGFTDHGKEFRINI